MAESSSSHTEINSRMTTEDEKKLSWQYVTKHERFCGVGGNCAWQLNFCQERRKGSYTRVWTHLLEMVGFGIGVCKVTPKDLADMQRLEEEAKVRVANNAPK